MNKNKSNNEIKMNKMNYLLFNRLSPILKMKIFQLKHRYFQLLCGFH